MPTPIIYNVSDLFDDDTQIADNLFVDNKINDNQTLSQSTNTQQLQQIDLPPGILADITGDYRNYQPETLNSVIERGFIGDVASNLARGARDLVEQTGYGLKTSDPEGGIDFVRKTGQKIIDYAKKAKSWDIMQPDASEQKGEGVWSEGWKSGIRSAVPSVAPLAAGGAAMLAAPILGIGAAGAATLGVLGSTAATLLNFGLGTYGQKKEEYLKKEIDEETAHTAALKQGLIEGGIEEVSNLLGILTFGFGKVATQPLKQTAKELLETPFSTFAKDLTKNAVLNEVPTEMLQSALESKVDENLGLLPEGEWQKEAVKAIIPTLTMSVLFGLGMQGMKSIHVKQIKNQLNDKNPEKRQKAVIEVAKNIKDDELRNAWIKMSESAIQTGKSIDIYADFTDFNIPNAEPADDLTNLGSSADWKADKPEDGLTPIDNAQSAEQALKEFERINTDTLDSLKNIQGKTEQNLDKLYNEAATGLGQDQNYDFQDVPFDVRADRLLNQIDNATNNMIQQFQEAKKDLSKKIPSAQERNQELINQLDVFDAQNEQNVSKIPNKDLPQQKPLTPQELRQQEINRQFPETPEDQAKRDQNQDIINQYSNWQNRRINVPEFTETPAEDFLTSKQRAQLFKERQQERQRARREQGLLNIKQYEISKNDPEKAKKEKFFHDWAVKLGDEKIKKRQKNKIYPGDVRLGQKVIPSKKPGLLNTKRQVQEIPADIKEESRTFEDFLYNTIADKTLKEIKASTAEMERKFKEAKAALPQAQQTNVQALVDEYNKQQRQEKNKDIRNDIPSKAEIFKGLEAKGFYGTIDRVKTGKTSLEDAYAELMGNKPKVKTQDFDKKKEPLIMGHTWKEIKGKQQGQDVGQIISPKKNSAVKQTKIPTREEYIKAHPEKKNPSKDYDDLLMFEMIEGNISKEEYEKQHIYLPTGAKELYAETRAEIKKRMKRAREESRKKHPLEKANEKNLTYFEKKTNIHLRKQHIDFLKKEEETLLRIHRDTVKEALLEGKNVPKAVLKDYPGLKEEVEKELKANLKSKEPKEDSIVKQTPLPTREEYIKAHPEKENPDRAYDDLLEQKRYDGEISQEEYEKLHMYGPIGGTKEIYAQTRDEIRQEQKELRKALRKKPKSEKALSNWRQKVSVLRRKADIEASKEREQRLLDEHRNIVKEAALQGKYIPETVFKEYPGLKEEVEKELKAETKTQLSKNSNSKFAQPTAEGKEAIVYITPETSIKIRYDVVEAKDLKTSHDINGNVNEGFPKELQPRDRSRAGSILQVNKISQTLNPKLLGEAPDAGHGAPIVAPDSNNVEAGHCRTLAIQSAYEKGERGIEYKKELKENAEKYGRLKKKINSMEQPILIRRRISEVKDLSDYVQKANESDMAKMSITEQAKIDSENLTQADLSLLNPSQEGDLTAASNKAFISKFLSKMSESEQAGYVAEDGKANKQLVDRMQAAIFHKAYSSDRLLKLAAEEANPDIRNILNALQVASKEFAKAQGIDNGITTEIGSKPIIDAIELIKQAQNEYPELKGGKDKNKTMAQLNQFLKQGSMFEKPVDKDTERIALFIAKNIRSGKKLGEFFKHVGEIIKTNLQDKNQQSLFGDITELTKQEVLDAAFRRMEDKYNDNQGTFFGKEDEQEANKTTPEFDFHKGAQENKSEPEAGRTATGDTEVKNESLPDIMPEYDLHIKDNKDGTFDVYQEDRWHDKGSKKGTFANKDLLKKLGAKWNSITKSWRFNYDPTQKINAELHVEHEGLSKSDERYKAAISSKQDMGGAKSGRDRKERANKKGTISDIKKWVNSDTSAALKKGLNYGIPKKVINQQIEDVALINRAFKQDKKMFLLANEAGTGKTFVLGAAIQEMKRNGANKILYVTMNNQLIKQIKKDLTSFDIDNVDFKTYAKMRKEKSGEYDVVIFDEAHNIKNLNSQNGKKAINLINKSKFAIFASATPFENPIEAGYLSATGVFGSQGHWNWAIDHGAIARTFYDHNGKKRQQLIWPEGEQTEKAIKARNWFIDHGVMTQRDMQLSPEQSHVAVHAVNVPKKTADLYSKVSVALDRKQESLNMGERGQFAMYKVGLQKRMLESAKIDAGIEAAKEALKKGRFPIIFVETKAKRELNIKKIIEDYESWQTNPFEPDGEKKRPPYSKAVYNTALALKDAGINELKLEPTVKKIIQAFGKENVAVYTGEVSEGQAKANLQAWRKGKKKILVATMAKGGTGLSLHDTKGDHPTTQININLPWKASGVAQVSGRSARYGVIGTPETHWIFAKNIPFDKELANKVSKRMQDMGASVKGDINQLTKDVKNLKFSVASKTNQNTLYSRENKKPWPKDFPNAIIHTSIKKMKADPDYIKAKAGDIESARRLVTKLIKPKKVLELLKKYPDAIIVAPHAVEESGKNAIPAMMAEAYRDAGFKVNDDIIQINTPKRTKKNGFLRLAIRPIFDGHVEPNREYILIDDTIGQGGTLSELRHYIENKGGKVVSTSALTSGIFGAKISIRPETIKKIINKFGRQETEEFLNEFNIAGKIEALTEKEGQKIFRQSNLESIRTRILEEAQEANISPRTWEVQTPVSERIVNKTNLKEDLKEEIAKTIHPDAQRNLRIDIYNSFEDLKDTHPIFSKNDDVVGAYDPGTGRISLFADKINKDEVHSIVMHETVHMARDKGGWRAVFGKNSDEILEQIKRNIKDGTKDEWIQAQEQARNAETPKEDLLEETISYFLQNRDNAKKGIFQKIKRAIAGFLYRTGIKTKITDDVIHNMADRMLKDRAMGRGVDRKSTAKAIKFAKKKAQETEDHILQDEDDVFTRVKDFISGNKKFLGEKAIGEKRDLNMVEHVFGTTMFNAEHQGGAYERLYKNVLNKLHEHKLLKQNELRNEGDYSLFEAGTKLKKEKPSLYKRVNRYIVKDDIDGYGYTVKKNKDTGLYEIYNPEGKRVSEPMMSFDKAYKTAFEIEAKNSKLTDPEKEILINHRKMVLKLYHHYADTINEIIRQHELAGVEVPKVTIIKEGKPVKVSLKTAMMEMGNRVGYYFPRIRQSGDWKVEATKEGAPSEVKFFKTKFGARQYKAQMIRRGYKTTFSETGTLSEDIYQTLAPLLAQEQVINKAFEKMSTSEDFDASMADLFVKQYAAVIKSHGSRSRMIGRSDAMGMEVKRGYETDLVRAMAGATDAAAGGWAKQQAAINGLKTITGKDLTYPDYLIDNPDATYIDYLKATKERGIDASKEHRAYREATAALRDVLKNNEFADNVIASLKSAAVVKYLGFRIPSAIFNTTNMVLGVPGALAGELEISIPKAFKVIGSAGKEYLAYRTGNKKTQLTPLFKEIEKRGLDTPQFNQEAVEALQTRTEGAYRQLIDKSMYLFGVTERINRAWTVAANYKAIAEKAGKPLFKNGEVNEKWLEQAVDISNHAHGDYGKSNRMYVSRGDNIGAHTLQTYSVFMTFSQTYLQEMARLGLVKKQYAPALYMALSGALIGGVGATVPMSIAKAIAKLFNTDDPEEATIKALGGSDFVRYGLPAAFGFSTKGTLAMRFEPPEKFIDMFGAPGSLVEDVFYGLKNISQGFYGQGAEKILPTAFGSPLRALRERKQGVTTRSGSPIFFGKEQIKANDYDTLLRFFSFNPTNIDKKKSILYSEYSLKKRYNEYKRELYKRYKMFYLSPPEDRDKNDLINLYADIRDFNKELKNKDILDIVTPITPNTLRSTLRRALRPSKRERLR